MASALANAKNGAAPAEQEKSHSHKLILQTIAGAGSGAVTKTATAPLERIKIIFQIQASGGLRQPRGAGVAATQAGDRPQRAGRRTSPPLRAG